MQLFLFLPLTAAAARAASSKPLPKVTQGSFGMDWGHISLLPFQRLPETQQAHESSSAPSAQCVGSGLQHLQRVCWMVEGAHLNEKKRLRVRFQHSPCLLYSLFSFCFPVSSFMFPRIINSHFSTGQEVHSWPPVLPALLLCPCCPATAAQPQAMPGHRQSHRQGSADPGCSDPGKVGCDAERGDQRLDSKQPVLRGCGNGRCWFVTSRAAHGARLSPTGWENSGVFHSISFKGSTPSMGSSNSSRDNTLSSPRVGQLVSN